MSLNQNTIELAGVELNGEFPFMNAPGSVNGAGEENLILDFMDVVRAPGAAITVGSGTIPFKEGNEAQHGSPVVRLSKETGTGLTYNSMGLPNVGEEGFKKLLPTMAKIAHDYDKKLIFSAAPLTAEPGKEWVQLASMALESGVDIIEFNAGCPNIFDENGKPKTVLSLVTDALGEALEYVQDQMGSDFAAGVKLSPAPVEGFSLEDSSNADSPLIVAQAGVINSLRLAKYVAYFNTFGGRIPVDKDGNELPLTVPGKAGGVSGPGVAHIARAQTEAMLAHLAPGIDVVIAGGIATGGELQRRVSSDPRIKLGSAVTALWEAPSMGQAITRIAQEYADLDG